MRAIDVIVRDVVTVRPDTDVADATKLMAEHDFSALPVLDAADNLAGISARPTSSITSRRRCRASVGLVGSPAERKALLALAESVSGVSRVSDENDPGLLSGLALGNGAPQSAA